MKRNFWSMATAVLLALAGSADVQGGEITCEGGQLLSEWKAFGDGKQLPQSSFPDLVAPEHSGISNDKLDWNAADIKAVEVKFRAFDEGGYLQLDFTAEDNGRKLSSFQTMSTVADGQWHSLYFPVSEEPAWRGKVKQVVLTWQNTGKAQISFAKVCAMSEKNLIPDAWAASEMSSFKIPLVRPRGHYRLSWKGNSCPSMELTVFDRFYREIAKVKTPAGATAAVEFSAPEMTMTAQLELDGKGAGYPVLELVDLPHLDLPAAWWRGSWIWNSVGVGQNNATVWFKREFDLLATPEKGAMVISADDRCDIYLNGKEFKGCAGWDTPINIDVTSALKAGHNELIVKVLNVQAWGGLIADLYARTSDGKDHFVSTDANWLCHEGGDQIPPRFEAKPLVIGRPPVAPWGTRMTYSYVGPMGELEMLKTGAGEFTAKVLAAPAIVTDKLMFDIKRADGSSKLVERAITPSTDKWRTGETITVKFNLPPDCVPGPSRSSAVFIASAFVTVKANTPAGVDKTIPTVSRKLSAASVSGTGGRAYIEVNGERLAPIYFDMPSALNRNPNGSAHHLRNAVAGGSRIIRMAQDLSEIWKSPSEIDLSNLDQIMDVIGQNAPDAYVMMVLKCGMPDWWLAANPDEVLAYYGGMPRQKDKDRQSLASKKWLVDMRPAVKQIIDHIKNRPYAAKFIGMTLSEGWNSEWFWPYCDANGKPAFAGFSPTAIRAYRDFLMKKYLTDEALAKAWNTPGIKLGNAMPPRPEHLDEGNVGILLDPVKNRDVIDFFEFRNVAQAEAIEALAKAVKEETEGHWLAGAYYGYLIAFSGIYNRLQHVGHMAIDKIARSPYIDFAIGPSFYTWRRMGMADSPMQPADAFSCHGKLVIIEQDLRDFSEPSHYEARNGRVNTVEESIGAIDRAFGMLLARGLGTHWMEMYENWFREKVVLDLIKAQMDFYNSLPAKPAGTTPTEVCFISDTESAFYVENNKGDGIHQLLTFDIFRKVNEAGFAFRHVLLSDILEKGVVPANKVYVVTNLLVLDQPQRQALLERFKAEKAVVVWLYAPGVFYPDNGPSTKNITALLGLEFQQLNERQCLRMLPAKGLAVSPVTNSATISTSPWFLPVGGFDKVLAETPEGKPAMVSYGRDGVAQYFAAVPNLSPEMLRHIAADAGVWIYGETGDPLHIGNDFVVLHAKTGGAKSLRIPAGMVLKPVIGPLRTTLKPGDKFDAVAGRTYGFQMVKE